MLLFVVLVEVVMCGCWLVVVVSVCVVVVDVIGCGWGDFVLELFGYVGIGVFGYCYCCG